MIDLQLCAMSVCEIAEKAGEYIKDERRKFSLESVERKHAHDYVSYVDKQSEQLIVSELRNNSSLTSPHETIMYDHLSSSMQNRAPGPA